MLSRKAIEWPSAANLEEERMRYFMGDSESHSRREWTNIGLCLILGFCFLRESLFATCVNTKPFVRNREAAIDQQRTENHISYRSAISDAFKTDWK
jgi:hypothetical protein